MGSCSSVAARDDSIPEVTEKADGTLITVVRSSDGELLRYPAPVFLKDLLAAFRNFPVLSPHPDRQLSFNASHHRKPLLPPRTDGSSAQDHHAYAAQTLQMPELERPFFRQQDAAADANSFNHLKISKKVRFGEETELISPHGDCSSSSNEDEASSWSSTCNGKLPVHQDLSSSRQGSQNEHLLDDGGAMRCGPSCPDDEIPRTRPLDQRKILNGVVRMKIVISRKDFTELMSPTTPQRRAEAMAERIIGPLLSPRHAGGALSDLALSR